MALVALYVPLAGAGPSIQRAGVMGIAGLVAALAGRPASRWYALGLAAAVTLASTRRRPASPDGSSRSLPLRVCSRSRPRLRGALTRSAHARPGRRGRRDHARGDRIDGAAHGAALRAGVARSRSPRISRRGGRRAGHVARDARDRAGTALAGSCDAAQPAVRAAARLPGVGRARGGRSAACGASGPAGRSGRPHRRVRGPRRRDVRGVQGRPGRAAASTRARRGRSVAARAAGWPTSAIGRQAGRSGARGARSHGRGPDAAARLPSPSRCSASRQLGRGRRRGSTRASSWSRSSTSARATRRCCSAAGARCWSTPVRPDGPILRRLAEAGVRRLDMLVLTHAEADHEGMALPVIARAPAAAGARRRRRLADGGAARAARGARAQRRPRASPRAPGRCWSRGAAHARPVAARAARPTGGRTATRTTARSSRTCRTGRSTCSCRPTRSRTSPPRSTCRASRRSRWPTTAAPTTGCPRCSSDVRPQVAAIEVGGTTPTATPRRRRWARCARCRSVVRTDRDGTVRLHVAGGRMRLEGGAVT